MNDVEKAVFRLYLIKEARYLQYPHITKEAFNIPGISNIANISKNVGTTKNVFKGIPGLNVIFAGFEGLTGAAKNLGRTVLPKLETNLLPASI
ncbi:MAG: hypothetical protein QXQ43_03695 [Nitrososphaerota archaeon]